MEKVVELTWKAMTSSKSNTLSWSFEISSFCKSKSKNAGAGLGSDWSVTSIDCHEGLGRSGELTERRGSRLILGIVVRSDIGCEDRGRLSV